VVLRTDQEPVAASVTRVFQALVDLKYVGPTEFGRLTGGQRPKRARPAGKAGKGRRSAAARAAARRTSRKAPRAAARAKRRR